MPWLPSLVRHGVPDLRGYNKRARRMAARPARVALGAGLPTPPKPSIANLPIASRDRKFGKDLKGIVAYIGTSA
jgi:hypothetical protein